MRKSFVTKVKALAMALAVFSSVFAANPETAKAESNINLNQLYTISTTGVEKLDYSFQTPQSGYFRVRAAITDYRYLDGGKDVLGSARVKLVYDYTNYLEAYLSDSDGYKTSPNYSLPAGKTVKLSFDCLNTNRKYTLSFVVETQSPANFEKEYNDTSSKANKIKVKKSYSGIINGDNVNDVDWYVFKAPKTGNYKFSVVNTSEDDWLNYFYVTGYKSKHSPDSKYPESLVSAGNGWYKSKKIRLKKGKKYYIKINNGSRASSSYIVRATKVK
ncbi:hypothetical protein [Butyrivibrio sp. JL13D10]|uniref:hypothetical protein n=1 Tax=Butyrivibrio sp. JL13D10 TaxID=3236815 RepID=UPI0038B5FE83